MFPDDASLDAALVRCPTAGEIALVDSVVTLVYDDNPSAPALVCHVEDGSADLTRLQERAYQAVLAMRRIPFDAPLPWTELSLFDWFAGVVNGITFRITEFSYCCDGPGVIVIKTGSMGYLMSDLWVARDGTSSGLMGLVALLIHEARHIEGFSHTCADGKDQAFEEMGSWALVYLFYLWLAEHAPGDYMTPVDAPADLYIRTARFWADGTLKYQFCTP